MDSFEGFTLKTTSWTTETRSGSLDGLKRLVDIDKLLVCEGKMMPKGMYTVSSDDWELLFSSTEALTEIEVGCSGMIRGFYMDLLDAAKQEVISFRRPATSGLAKLQVRVGGVLVAVVRHHPTFRNSVQLMVRDANEKKVLRIKGPNDYRGKCDFDILTLTKQPIGAITKLFDSKKQGHIVAYKLIFPRDLEVKYKAAVLGACILIDFMCFEKSW